MYQVRLTIGLLEDAMVADLVIVESYGPAVRSTMFDQHVWMHIYLTSQIVSVRHLEF